LARHFGFCYGVENAIEIAYKTIEENPGKRIYLLSEMIHNPIVNEDLRKLGVKFLMDTSGNQLINWADLNADDIIIIPAFGTTIEIEKKLNDLGIDPYRFNTTCPFVEKVWNKSSSLADENYTVIIHGKHFHEETKATFSHSKINTPSVIIKNIEEAKVLASIILKQKPGEYFYSFFEGKYSGGFSIERDLQKVGVVNQTTMLATETQEISDLLKQTMIKKYGMEELKNHFADTRDTLCYATNDNQEATNKLLETGADFAIVVGGYNSSNTSHIVELCKAVLPAYFISSDEKILSFEQILHFDISTKEEIITDEYIPAKKPVDILLTSGASCPDAIVETVLKKIVSFFEDARKIETVIDELLLKDDH
ncbi:MAG TPA: 4-hydroxy-3-methylbut-2-enyl diphosphate reductase, partial [Ignavibacteriales bacterium]|nr:4-hydroxy-3-methylbut-2-enyl diphosphate reductase [Ignavibacteriales bacterium]